PRAPPPGGRRLPFGPPTPRRGRPRPCPRRARRSRRCSRAPRAAARPLPPEPRARPRCRSQQPEPPPSRDSRAVAAREARGGTLVVGGGFAGGYVARLLRKRGATIVSPENFMLYTPMLPEAASGTLEPRQVVVPLRLMCPRAELLLGHAVALDAKAQRVQVET